MPSILIDVGHPAHVHLFRNAARDWREQGHNILFTALDREVVVDLLDAYQLPYRVTCRRRKGKLALVAELILRTLTTYRIARSFKPDLFISMGNPTVGLPARLMGKPYMALTDTEHATEQHALFKPFATVIATPSVFTLDMGPKQIRYPAYHELAYLHPDEFTPDPAVLKSLGLTPDDRFFIVRFVAWGATHDIGHHGFTMAEKRDLLRDLAQHGRVLLSVEGDVDPEFAPYVTHFPPEQIHHLLAFATLYVGEGGTMASESAVLGTPSVFVNTLTLGYCQDLQNAYGMLFWYPHSSDAVVKVRELLAYPNLKQEWAERRTKLLQDKIDPTPWFVDLGNRLIQNPHDRPE